MIQTTLLTANLGVIDPTSLEEYIEHGGYRALRRVVDEMNSPQIIGAIQAAGLVGRGGAAFPTGVKHQSAVQAELRHPWPAPPPVPAPYQSSSAFIVCNADESETGTFKDRLLMEGDPFRILEGMAIVAYAACATNGFIYIRGEYALAYERLSHAIQEARRAGWLGPRILRDDFAFDVEVRRGAGAYICGEETALFESIEGKRGEPRSKPPFPTENGLFGRPTIINNVETFANVPAIAQLGAEGYRRYGTPKSPGTRVVCVSGNVRRPGAFEIEMGTPLRSVIEELAGGLLPGRSLQAVLIGGAAGAFLRPDEIDVPLDFHSLSSVGATFGSGAIMVIDDSIDVWGVLVRLARFFRRESCGKCFPCQLGTLRQEEIVTRMAEWGTAEDDKLLRQVGATMREASLCGLGQTASNAILSALDKGLVEGAKAK